MIVAHPDDVDRLIEFLVTAKQDALSISQEDRPT
jgi:hypothetical protein